MTNNEIQEIFFLECDTALEEVENGLIACQAGGADDEIINSMFRAIHSIKGGAGAFGFVALQELTHSFETVLALLRDGDLEISESLVGTMLQALDLLMDHIAAIRDDGNRPDDADLLAQFAAISAEPRSSEDGKETASPVVDETADVRRSDDVADIDLDFDLDSLLDDCINESRDEPADEPVDEPANITESAAALSVWHVNIYAHPNGLVNGKEPMLLLRELVRIGGKCIEFSYADIPLLEHFDVNGAWLRWVFQLPGEVAHADIDEIFDFYSDSYDLQIERQTGKAEPTPCAETSEADLIENGAPSEVDHSPLPVPAADRSEPPETQSGITKSTTTTASRSSPQSIRVDPEKLDDLINLVGELVIGQAILVEQLENQESDAADEIATLERLTREIQESAMTIRKQPIASIFSRIPRIIRELEAETGKQVRLEITGEYTELDKAVVERLSEPLTHLIRNAVDHGLEDGAERIAAGKSEEGLLRISAEQCEGHILISIADDGQGINRAAVVAKAIERKLIPTQANLADEDIDALIFAPGFSTAANITHISGRGVGMDVVSQSIKNLGGRVGIVSEPGKGCTFTLTLPLSLAVTDGMAVSVEDQSMIIPLGNIIENRIFCTDSVQYLSDDYAMVNVRGRFLPIISLRQYFNLGDTAGLQDDGVIVIVETEDGAAALLVDSIFDQRQYVIRNMDSHCPPIDGVTGATILGDGCVALILNIDNLITSKVDPSERFRRVA